MSETLRLTIDGRPAEAAPGETLLTAARRAGVQIPVLCYSDHTTANGLCRLCAVEVEGVRGLQAACVTAARDGAVVHTQSARAARARRTLLELLASAVDLSESPELLALIEASGVRPERFAGGETLRPPLIDDNPVYIRDYAKCVMCWRCVQVCAEDAQYAFALTFSGRGFHTSIATFFDRPMTATSCVFCGQCVGVCPSGALKGRREHLLEQGLPPGSIGAQTLPPRRRGPGPGREDEAADAAP